MYRQVPNLITVGRLGLTLVFFLLLNVHEAGTFPRQMVVAFCVFIVAVLTDILDGYLARKWKVESAFGRVVDPFVDKILICGAFVFFSSDFFISVARQEFPADAQEGIITGVHPWMAVALIAREFLITSIRGLAESQGMDFRADWAGKVKMFTQSFAIGAIMVDLAETGHVEWVRVVRDWAIWITVVVTLLSCITYILRARKLFSQEKTTT